LPQLPKQSLPCLIGLPRIRYCALPWWPFWNWTNDRLE
jgi:hypothetical protein